MPVRLLYSVGSVPFGYPRCLRCPTALGISRQPMPVRSIFCRLVLWVLGASSVSLSMSVSVVASSSSVLVDRWARCSRNSVCRFFPRVWLIACLVVVINRVILGCDGTILGVP